MQLLDPRHCMSMPARARDEIRSDRFLIIELFAKRQRHYDHAEVLRLTCSTEEQIAAAVEAGDLQPRRTTNGELHYAWQEVATFALQRWTPRMIANALGAAIPDLNGLQTIEVQLPRYQVRMLDVLASAEREGFRGALNAGDILEQLLHDLANSVDADAMEEAIPGFRAAVQYP